MAENNKLLHAVLLGQQKVAKWRAPHLQQLHNMLAVLEVAAKKEKGKTVASAVKEARQQVKDDNEDLGDYYPEVKKLFKNKFKKVKNVKDLMKVKKVSSSSSSSRSSSAKVSHNGRVCWHCSTPGKSPSDCFHLHPERRPDFSKQEAKTTTTTTAGSSSSSST